MQPALGIPEARPKFDSPNRLHPDHALDVMRQKAGHDSISSTTTATSSNKRTNLYRYKRYGWEI